MTGEDGPRREEGDSGTELRFLNWIAIVALVDVVLLIPLACGLFGIPTDVAMQVVAVGFIIGVVQDSCETALNSSTDVVFTAAVSQRAGA